jgi:Phage terminase large subunit gpA, ATPase domain
MPPDLGSPVLEAPGGSAWQERRDFAYLLEDIDRGYAADPWLWLVEQVITLDEASQAQLPWPDFAYLHDLIDALQSEQLVAVPKSRRMMVSWTLAAWVTWLIRYHPHHAVLWQSETETKAAYILDKRMAWIEDHLHTPLLRRAKDTTKTVESLVGRITYRQTGSWALAIPQGAAAVRSYTPSVVVMDECDFQPQAAEALAATMAFAEKGSKIILVSSSNGPGQPLAEIAGSVGFTRWR